MAKVTSFSYPDNDNTTSAIIDKWEKQGKWMKSQKIRKAIKMLHEDEERGSKITAFTGQQSKLPLLPAVYEIPTTADLDGLSYNELRTIAMSIKQWDAIVTKRIISEQRLK